MGETAMDMRWALLFGFPLLAATPVSAREPPAFQTLWNEVAHDPDCKPSQFPDFVVFSCRRELRFWYFTKPNHPAHPGIIKRYLYQKDGTWYSKEEGHSFASDAAQPAFKAWLAQIADQDRQVLDQIKKQQSQNPTGR
jgi:hypothetical protein